MEAIDHSHSIKSPDFQPIQFPRGGTSVPYPQDDGVKAKTLFPTHLRSRLISVPHAYGWGTLGFFPVGSTLSDLTRVPFSVPSSVCGTDISMSDWTSAEMCLIFAHVWWL